MRIAFDIRKINEFGVGTYIWNLVRNLAAIDHHNEYFLLGSQRNFHELGPLPANFKQLYQPDDDSVWRNHAAVPLALWRQKVDVVHVPHYQPPLVLPSKLLLTIHDCVHVLFPPEESSRFKNYREFLRSKKVIQSASHLVAVSHSTKDDLINVFNVPESKISVIHNALDERFTLTQTTAEQKVMLERYQLHDPFILYSGRIRPHKNLHRLIEAFAVLKSELASDERYKNLKLIIIGDELSRHQYLRLTVVRSGVQQDVRFFGFVPYSTLQVFYQCAALFAFPSLYEGFGLPPLEAMANRLPVVASNTSSLPEVLDEAAVLVNPENVFEIARGMRLILEDEVTRQRLIKRGVEQAMKYSWKAAARKVIETYEMIHGSSVEGVRKMGT
jgi:glycosyltransferase involved in cell wall biosynthesis